jgi:ABC-type branched-subunit amino acid transport system substrate-binding protein
VRAGIAARLPLALCALCVLAGCALSSDAWFPRSTKPIVKIGLVAPFERRYRDLGYEALHAVKLAVRERNERGGVAGAMIELVALNDDADPASSALQGKKLSVDWDVVGVIGPFTDETLVAAAGVYAKEGLPAISPAVCSPSVAERADGVFCLGAGVAELGDALLGCTSASAPVALLRGRDGPLGDRLAMAVPRVLDLPLDVANLDETAVLYDGDALSAADMLLEMRRAGVEAVVWGGPSLARTQLPQVAQRVPGAASACYAITAPLYPDATRGDQFPGPWAALAYDAAQLLLDAIERDALAEGRATRDGVRAQLGRAVEPGGQPVFVREQRRAPEIVCYCYVEGEPYPGRMAVP